MSKQYSPLHFFRKVPNKLLKQYFSARNLLEGINFDDLTETNIAPIYQAWLELSDDIRNKVEQDFQEINEMAHAGGSKFIIAEALHYDEDLTQKFASLKSFHEHAFWTFLERPQYWSVAIMFNHVDSIPTSYWRKRKNIPPVVANTDAQSIKDFEQSLGKYFYTMQGRGKNCKVDHYHRDDLDYFFAHPEDYAQLIIGWEDATITRHSYNPAFEIIFVYSQEKRTLDIYIPGDRTIMPDLQEIYAQYILKIALPPDKKDDRVYDLSPLRSKNFTFRYDAASGIENVVITKLRFKALGSGIKFILEVPPSHDGRVIYDQLNQEFVSYRNPYNAPNFLDHQNLKI